MVNLTASIFIKSTVAFNRGDTFIFGSWVCTADGAGSFQRHLTMTPNPKTGLVTLPEVITGNLAGKFSEISLCNQHTDFESGSASNSNSTSTWVTACESATEPSCVDAPPHEHFPYGLCNASRAHAEALAARWAGKEIVSDYSSDSKPASGYSTPPTSSTSGRILTSPSPRTPQLSNRCQDSHRPGYNIYTCRQIRLLAGPLACRPDKRELVLHCLPRLTSLAGGNTPSSNRGAYSNRGGDY
jgi:hypothetical protein